MPLKVVGVVVLLVAWVRDVCRRTRASLSEATGLDSHHLDLPVPIDRLLNTMRLSELLALACMGLQTELAALEGPGPVLATRSSRWHPAIMPSAAASRERPGGQGRACGPQVLAHNLASWAR